MRPPDGPHVLPDVRARSRLARPGPPRRPAAGRLAPALPAGGLSRRRALRPAAVLGGPCGALRGAFRGARRGLCRCLRRWRGGRRIDGARRAECQGIGAKRCRRTRRGCGGRGLRPDRSGQQLRNQQHDQRHEDDGARQSLFHPEEYTPSHSSAGPTVCTEPQTTTRSPASRGGARRLAGRAHRIGQDRIAYDGLQAPRQLRRGRAPRPFQGAEDPTINAPASARAIAGASLSPRMPTTASVRP